MVGEESYRRAHSQDDDGQAVTRDPRMRRLAIRLVCLPTGGTKNVTFNRRHANRTPK
jgi:hypothetical protein